ncbi:MAG TPA: amidohydrolase, partial [Candidatus Glassbacteria bacterium]|nr:amidohydrolase [Candidatus Glassbacteria bacterium]
TRVIDLAGAFVTPGFNDAHCHLISVGAALEKIDLTGVSSLERVRELVAERVARVKPGELVVGRGWDHTLLPGQQWPTKEILDEVSPDNPVFLSRVDGHSLLVNSYVLKRAGITRATPDPEGGKIVRDPANGEPTGVLKETAAGLVHQSDYGGNDDPAAAERHLELALDLTASLGVTSVSNISRGEERLLEKFAQEGKLTTRIYYCPPLPEDEMKLDEYTATAEKWKVYSTLRFGFLKDFIDGTLGSATAALFEPYSDDPSTSGVLVETVEELQRKVLAADRRSFQIGVHAIGTRGNRLVLDAFEKAIEVNGQRDSRHRIEHTQLLTEFDLPRFAALGVIASMQPTHCITDKRFAERRLGLERCRYAYAWRSVLSAGGRIAFGTDAPVEPLDPLEGLYAAVTRKDRQGEEGPGWIPEEKLSMAEAIELYTLGSAYAEFQENEKGSIAPGKLADIVVLSSNLLEAAEDEIMTTRVVYTIFDGRVIYSRE